MKRATVLLAAAALIAVFSVASGTQEQGKQIADKYAAYCGQYRFDLASMGIGVVTVKFYVENDGFYVWAETSDSPDVISPVEKSETKFFLDDPEEGRWEFEFLKDEKGKFTKCHLVNSGMGVDVVGAKIDG